MKAFVVDVNVAIVANEKSSQAATDCIKSCQDALQSVVADGIVVLDDAMLILDEYRRNLSMAGQPGLGDFFFKWLWDHQRTDSRCEIVCLTQDTQGDFVHFPCCVELQKFDRSDRKYVAAALASHKAPEVLNAVDKHWWDFRESLAANGVNVRFVCPHHFTNAHAKRRPGRRK